MKAQDDTRERACGSCGATIDVDARFCAFCGTEIEQTSPSDANQRTSAGICPNCGEPRPSSDTKLCMACGHQFFMEIELPLPDASEAGNAGSITTQDTSTGRHVDRQTAGFLAIFLGTVGVHKFYMGHIGAGILCCIFCWTFVPTIIGILDGIKLFSMTEQEFQTRLKRHE